MYEVLSYITKNIVFRYTYELNVDLKNFGRYYKEQTRQWKMSGKFKFTIFQFDLI